MGGIVQVAIRLNDKLRKNDEQEVYNMCRSVNNVSDYFLDNKFFEEDRSHLDKYLNSWLRMKSDYEKHKDDKNFEIDSTKLYFPYNSFIPNGYGSILIDYKTKTILSMQNYTSIIFVRDSTVIDNYDYNSKNIFFKYLDFDKLKYLNSYEMVDISTSSAKIDVTSLLKNNKKTLISKFGDFNRFNRAILDKEIKRTLEFAEIVNSTDDNKNKKARELDDYYYKNIIWLYPDLGDWSFIKFKSNNEGAKSMLSELKNLDFNLTKKEEMIWNNFYLEEED